MNENEKETTNVTNIQYIINSKQVNIVNDNGTINALQENPEKTIVKQIIINNTYKQENSRRKNTSEKDKDTSDNGVIFLLTIVLIMSLSIYSKYHLQIKLTFIGIATLIEGFTIGIYYLGKRNHIVYDNNMKKIIYFNIFALITVIILICIISRNTYIITLINFQKKIDTYGVIQAYIKFPSLGQDILFQMVGVLLLGFFLIYIVTSDLYVIAIINIVREKNRKALWNKLLRYTCGSSKEGNKHIRMGILLILINVFFTTGIFSYFLGKLQNYKMK